MTSPAGRRNVPLAVTDRDRIPASRYYDQEFFDLEREHFWPHVWQMACRLEEIPEPGDFVEYANVGKSVIVIRNAAGGVNAFHNACRHRGVQLVQDRGNVKNGFICPFHGWCYDLEGVNTFVYSPDHFREENLDPAELNLAPCRVDTWGGMAFINHDDDAPPLRQSLEPFATAMDAFNADQMRIEWSESCLLPTNWRLALGAFLEGYHVRTTHPQILPKGTRGKDAYKPSRPGVEYASRYAGHDDVRTQVDNFLFYLRALNEGNRGMISQPELAIAESLRNVELPDTPTASKDFTHKVYEALMAWGEETGTPIPDFDHIVEQGIPNGTWYAFPNVFLQPIFSSAPLYRVRPLGPELTLFDIWSLTPYAPGEAPPTPPTPTPMAPDDPRWPLIPAQDFSNLPKQQLGLHATGFEYMRLAEGVEGMVSNVERMVDTYLGGADPARVAELLPHVSGRIGHVDMHPQGFFDC
ncbi:MAG: aromatic ring-hydroxylating oxygenase subunit alpha [Acidimicrobiales bacterium]